MPPLTHPTMTAAEVRVWQGIMEQKHWLHAVSVLHEGPANPWERYECTHCGEVWSGVAGGSCLACRASLCPVCNESEVSA